MNPWLRILKRARMENSFCCERKYHSHHDYHDYLNGDPYDSTSSQGKLYSSRSTRSLASFPTMNNHGENLLSLEAPAESCDWDQRLQRSDLYTSTMEYLHYIDSVSRKLFPATFLLCNLIYWTSYIYVL